MDDLDFWRRAIAGMTFITVSRVRDAVGREKCTDKDVHVSMDGLTDLGELRRRPIYVAWGDEEWSEFGQYWERGR